MSEVTDLVSKLKTGDFESEDWILVYKPGLEELILDHAKLQLKVIELKERLKKHE